MEKLLKVYNLNVFDEEYAKKMAINNTNFVLKLLSSIGFFTPKKVHFSNPATVVEWEDGTKTIVKCGYEDTYDQEKGLAMCFIKKLFGNKGNYYDKFNELIDPDYKKNRRREKNARRKAEKTERNRRKERLNSYITKAPSYKAYDLKEKTNG